MDSWVAAGFPVNRATAAVGLSRSSYYYHQSEKDDGSSPLRGPGRPTPGYSFTDQSEKVPDAQIEEYLMEYHYHDQLGGLGYRKWTLFLQRDKKLVINKKKVYRLCQKLGILKKRRFKQPKHPRRMAKHRQIDQPNQLWQVDIKYGSIDDSDHFFFVCSAIDVYDRSIVGYYCGSTCQAKDIRTMLTKAIMRRQVHLKPDELEDKLIIRSDNGPQFVSACFGDFCHFHRLYHERIPNKSPDLNAYIESFHSQLQRECFDRFPFEFYEQAFYEIDRFMTFYNQQRPHGSIQDYAPSTFYELTLEGVIEPKPVTLS